MCSRSAQDKPKANARKKSKPQPTSSGSIPSVISDRDEDVAEDELHDNDEASHLDAGQKSPLRVAKERERPDDRGKARKKAVFKVDKENATPELARRAAASPAAAKPGRYASGLIEECISQGGPQFVGRNKWKKLRRWRHLGGLCKPGSDEPALGHVLQAEQPGQRCKSRIACHLVRHLMLWLTVHGFALSAQA